jgi:hypothetical protein
MEILTGVKKILNGNMWKFNTKFKGMFSLRTATEISQGFCASSLNSNLGSSSQAGQEKGYLEFGHQTNAEHTIIRKYTYIRGDGSEVQLQVRDNGTNYILEYLNKEDVRNSANGEWSILEAGLTRTRTLKDGTVKEARFDFAPFNDTGTDQCIYSNGIEALRIWNGAVGKILSSTANTITLSGTLTCAQRGFASSGSLVINGTTYTYSGLSTTSFTGVGTTPVGEALGSGITQLPDSTTLTAIDKGSILLTCQSRMFMAGISGTPNQVDYSDVGSIANWDGASVSDGGFEDFPDMNGDITALSYLGNWIVVFSANRIIAFQFDFPSSTTKTVIKKNVADEGCVNYKSIIKLGERIIYITPSGGIKQLTQVGDQDIFQIDNLTEPIRPTIKNFVWDKASLCYNPKNRILMASGRSSSDFEINDKCVALYLSLNEEGVESFNLDIKDWFIGDMCNYGGDLHFGGSASSKSYRAFDGYSKNGGPIIWKRIERIEIWDNPIERKWIKFLAVIGTIATGTTLYFKLKYDLNGKTTSQEFQLKGTDTPWVKETPLNTLGGFELGTEPLGGTIDDIDELNPFEVVWELPVIFPRNVQLEMWTDGDGQRCTVDMYGYDVYDAEQHILADELKATGN